MDEKKRKNIDEVCEALGVTEVKTAYKHLSRFKTCLNDFNTNLAGLLSHLGTIIPEKQPENLPIFEINLGWFSELTSELIKLRQSLFGFEDLSSRDIAEMHNFFLHPAYPCSTCTENTDFKIHSDWLKSPPDCTWDK
jgi:hypothetical protein